MRYPAKPLVLTGCRLALFPHTRISVQDEDASFTYVKHDTFFEVLNRPLHTPFLKSGPSQTFLHRWLLTPNAPEPTDWLQESQGRFFRFARIGRLALLPSVEKPFPSACIVEDMNSRLITSPDHHPMLEWLLAHVYHDLLRSRTTEAVPHRCITIPYGAEGAGGRNRTRGRRR